MRIDSPIFLNGQSIPGKYTCEGADVNPPLFFSDIPKKTASLALVVDDPDAPSGTFIHWLAWNITAETSTLPEDAKLDPRTMGTNGFGNVGYNGPCPPHGEEHRYFFRLYALDTMLTIDSGSTHAELNQAMGGHIIVQAEFFGLFKRA